MAVEPLNLKEDSLSNFDTKINLTEKEEEVLNFWNSQKIFEKSLEQRKKDNKVFYFYDGPPFATGLPHYGHILAGTIKDIIPRYKTMQGYYVDRRFGWDCHGLPVEFEAEKALKLNGKADIEAYGIPKFNEYCRSIVLHYAHEWEKTVQRMGRWVDFKRDYKTMDTDFMESIWYVFFELWKKGLIYSSYKIVPYSPRLHTPLSNFEVNLGYRMTKDPSIVVKFRQLGEENTYFLSWTTTPWTLPANFGLTVHPDVVYAKIELGQERYILAKDLIPAHFKGKDYKILKEWQGKELEYTPYQPLFPFAVDALKLSAALQSKTQGKERPAFFIMLADYVDTSTGTGIVHTAPNFGEDDYGTGQKYNLPYFLPFNESGEFLPSVPDYQGKFFKDADELIIQDLKKQGLLFHKTVLEHSYPFCWRSGVPLMFRTIPSWYVDVEKMKPTLLRNNQQIRWVPEHIQSGRMGKWLENARDWAISRNRYWGNPIPVWTCEKCGHQDCLSSRNELNQRIQEQPEGKGVELTDLHSHIIDKYPLKCGKCGSRMLRTPEVLDCWFESGAMPYAQMHYPFENKEDFEKYFPADFISEGLDQTRGWFYTLLILSTALLEKPAFKNCIVSGLILAEDGQKMSKSLRNYPDPQLMIEKYGADAIRMYMLGSGAVKAEELKFKEQGLVEILRDFLLPIWNVLNFFVTYSADKFSQEDLEALRQSEILKAGDTTGGGTKNYHPLDLWLVSRLESLKRKVTNCLDAYELYDAINPLYHFVEELTNWYLRTSRKRFQKGSEAEKRQSFVCLYHVLKEVSLLLAPFVPFFAESLFKVLRIEKDPESVHLGDFPQVAHQAIQPDLEEQVALAFKYIEMGRSLRAEKKIKLRQPLKSATIFSFKEEPCADFLKTIIQQELNVKELYFSKESEGFFRWELLPNLPVLGKKYKSLLVKIKDALATKQISFQELRNLEAGKATLELDLGTEKVSLSYQDLLIRYQELPGKAAISSGDVTLALETALDQDLIEEGLFRELTNKIQTGRKSLQFTVDEPAVMVAVADLAIQEVLKKYQARLQEDCSILSIAWQNKAGQDFIQAPIEEKELAFQLKKA